MMTCYSIVLYSYATNACNISTNICALNCQQALVSAARKVRLLVNTNAPRQGYAGGAFTI